MLTGAKWEEEAVREAVAKAVAKRHSHDRRRSRPVSAGLWHALLRLRGSGRQETAASLATHPLTLVRRSAVRILLISVVLLTGSVKTW